MLATAVPYDDHGVQRSQRDRHVGRVHGDAFVGSPQDCVVAHVAADGGATRSGFPLVARSCHVLEVDAAGSLHQIAGCCRGITKLP